MSTIRVTHRPRGFSPEAEWTLTDEKYNHGPSQKPDGFWVSIDRDWERWLDHVGYLDQPYWGYKTFELDLDTRKCLWIKTGAELVRFHEDYVEKHAEHRDSLWWDIDWHPLVRRYDGLIIAPYHRDLALFDKDINGWYGSWDVASGVIWNLSALTMVGEVCEAEAA